MLRLLLFVCNVFTKLSSVKIRSCTTRIQELLTARPQLLRRFTKLVVRPVSLPTEFELNVRSLRSGHIC